MYNTGARSFRFSSNKNRGILTNLTLRVSELIIKSMQETEESQNILCVCGGEKMVRAGAMFLTR